jgi:2-keto-4-pentenoate hydratase/2-oxohepta-3-ene-1,7-dioic acid hydratase in catechol pathway
MRFVVYGPHRRLGVLHEGAVVDASGAVAKFLAEQRNEVHALAMAQALAPSDLESFIEGGSRALDTTRDALDYLFGGAADDIGCDGEALVLVADEVPIHAPKPRRGRVAFCGGNFPAHAAAMAAQNNRQLGEAALDPRAQVRARGFWGSWKIERDAAGPDGRIRYPNGTTRFDYEGELAIVLGKQIKNAKAETARDAIWGITLFTDWSARDYPENPASLNFAKRKNFDDCYSLGPCIVVGEYDEREIDIETWVNDERRQSFNTRDMAYSFGEYLQFLSHGLTLYPGDIIASGTGRGTAMDSSKKGEDGKVAPDLFLQAGDRVEVKSPQIGSLRSTILAADPE